MDNINELLNVEVKLRLRDIMSMTGLIDRLPVDFIERNERFELTEEKAKDLKFFEDFKTAMNNYLKKYVELRFVDVGFQDGEGVNDWNEKEKIKFKWEIINNGHLDMKDINIVVNTIDGYVSLALETIDPYVENKIEFHVEELNAHEVFRSPTYVYGLLNKRTDGEIKDLVSLRITRWNANLDHLLMDHSRAENLMATPTLKHEIMMEN